MPRSARLPKTADSRVLSLSQLQQLRYDWCQGARVIPARHETMGKPMSEKQQNLQDTFLNAVRKSKSAVTIFLVNGVKLQGNITWFDNFCVLLRRDGQAQLVYKHAISTVMPLGPIQLQDEAAPKPLEALRVERAPSSFMSSPRTASAAMRALRDARGAPGRSRRPDRGHRPERGRGPDRAAGAADAGHVARHRQGGRDRRARRRRSSRTSSSSTPS